MATKITAEQRAKQKEALAKFHQDGREGKANTSANVPRPRKNKSLKELSDRMSKMLPKALDIIENVLDGKDVDKQSADMAKYVANNAVTLTKAQIQEEADLLKFKVDMAKAQEANIVPKEDAQEVARELAKTGDHVKSLNRFSMEFNEDEYEEVEDD